MHKRKPPQLKEDISPNLIPMIDIMFLLLLFFMLGADMGKRESEEVVLPLASQVKEDPNRSEERETTINIHHDPARTCPVHDNGGVCREEGHWLWSIRGKDFDKDTLKAQMQIEADANLEAEVDPEAKKRLSAQRVLVRADRTAPYGDIQKVIEICGTTGIYKIAVSAAKPPKG
jgi:biopolymer transport protein ExbD